jgi:3-hydroxy-9,10-secoandrosta-1,3,5(10)-triene-9,17-dione monooxygenase
MGTATCVDGGWLVEGRWDYCSGAPHGNFFLPSVMVLDGDGPPQEGVALIPREQWTMLDDWGDILGMRGSGSNSIVVDKQVIPDHAVALGSIMDVDVSKGTPGYRLHGNTLYAGRIASSLHMVLAAISVGTARAALDEYEQILRTRTIGPPPNAVPRFNAPDHQVTFGTNYGKVEAAETTLLGLARRHAELSRLGVEGERPFTVEDDALLMASFQHVIRASIDAAQELFFASGSTAAKTGARMQRYFRDLATIGTPAASQMTAFSAILTRIHFGQASSVKG